MRKVLILGVIVAAVAFLFGVAGITDAYNRYNDGCQTCHGAFTDGTSTKGSVFPSNDKHTMHRSSSYMATNCDLCHTSGDNRNPFIGSSTGIPGVTPGYGCSGCHGRNEGTTQTPNVSGAGLRQHHWWNNVTGCVSCHTDANPANFVTKGENLLPPFYGLTAYTKANTPCNTVRQDFINENWTIESPRLYEGLDNDGDNLYDAADSDCQANRPPLATNDSYSTNQNTALTVPAPGVLGNDTDPDGNPLTAALVATTLNGSLTLNSNGSFTYTPNTGFSGSDSFTYRANDGLANSNTATVSITVLAVNRAPVANNDTYTTIEDTTLVFGAPGVLGNDTDPDGNPLTAVLVSTTTNGTLTLNANGGFTYAPRANFSGQDTFTYRASDGQLSSNTATVTINVTPVNDAPVANNDSYATNQGTPLSVPAPGVLANDTDVDGNPLTAVLVSTTTNGTLTLSASGSFTYTPNAGFVGTDSFTYKANDGQLDSNIATVTITVRLVNRPPVAVSDSYTTTEDTPLTVPAPGVLVNDTDADGNPLTAILVAGPANGSVTLSPNGGFTYTPRANFFGSDSFTYKANDGQADSNTATVSITVTPGNDAPVAVNDSYSVNQDTTLTVAAPGVLANDSDVDTAALTAVLVSTTNGTLTLSASGGFTYTPNAGFVGTDSFTYKANDGQLDSNTATVTITVQAVAQADVFLSGLRASKSARISGTGTVGVTATGSGDTTSQTASVSLTAAYDAAVVSVVNPAPVSKTVTPGMSTKFGFTPTVTCLVPGVKTSITWTATISAPQNRDTTNDVRTAATAVTCR